MGGCISHESSLEVGRWLLSASDIIRLADEFENECCRRRSGACVAKRQYESAFYNYVYCKLRVDEIEPEPFFRSHVFSRCASFEPPLASQGGWRVKISGYDTNITWSGLEIMHFPNRVWYNENQKSKSIGLLTHNV